MRIVALTGIAILTLVACRDSGIQNAEGELVFTHPSRDLQRDGLDLGEDWVGRALTGEVVLQNRGRSEQSLEWTLPDNGFVIEDPPATAPSGDTVIRIRFVSDEPGRRTAQVTVRSGRRQATLTLYASARAIPECPVALNCHTVAFDLDKGECVNTPIADGTPCDPNNVCMVDPVCQQGVCVGELITCDDGNACTLNTCHPIRGCEFPPAPPCPGDGVCGVGVCDPETGCGLEPAPDGTSCGELNCDAAQVCIAGECVVRDPPDGFICAEPTPCQGAGVCQGSTCVQPPATPLASNWSLDSATVGEFPLYLHDFILEPTGELSLMGFFARPIIRVNGAVPVPLQASARRCIEWNGQLVCVDYRVNGVDGSVVTIDPATGTPNWVFTLADVRPDIRQDSDTLFLARIAAMGTDRIAALYESYPRNSGAGTQCRNYHLVILDAGGGMVAAQKLQDPLLSHCNHPHPYGMAADADGNLYMSFSPSSMGNAPLMPQWPALILSTTRDGVERWRTTRIETGGELAVANGRVFAEGSSFPLDAATGEEIPHVDPQQRERLGRIVSDGAGYVTSPLINLLGGGSIHGYDWMGRRTWTWTVPMTDQLLTRELRAITWHPRELARKETAVTTFVTRAGELSMVALRMSDGEELWSCPVDAPFATAPQLFEIARGSFAAMGNATTCGDCDPPFANSNALFATFPAQGIEPANVRWPGTFGGPGHDHQENLVPTAGNAAQTNN